MAAAAASRYARALADIVLAPGSAVKPADAVAQLAAVDETVAGSAELRAALLTPAIRASRKHHVMQLLLERIGVSSLIRNFVYVVIDHRRIGILSEIRAAFERRLDESLGFVRAEVTSASELDQGRSANLESELSHLTGKKMRLRFDVDPALLGGVVARIGSTVYDGSVRGQLRVLRRRLTEQSVE
jgi:F-type H+-transporting ATPase subunit delta